MDFFTIAKFLFSVLPLITQGVAAAEAAFPDQGQGASKLGTVLATLQAAHAAAPAIAADFDAIKPIATDMVNGVVAVMNQVRAGRAAGGHP